MLDAGMCYVPQGRNLFPELSVRHNLELGGVALADRSGLAARMDAMMARFPMLREKADAQASTLSGGQQKLLEVARGLLLDPKLMLIDEPSIGLSPLLVQEVFAILKDLRDAGVTILLIEQNARAALAISDYGLVLEQGQTRIEDTRRRTSWPIRASPSSSWAAACTGGGGTAMSERKLVGLIGANIGELAVAGAARGRLRRRRHGRPLPPDGRRQPAGPRRWPICWPRRARRASPASTSPSRSRKR